MPFPVVTTKWLICMFAEVLPVETVLRIWDCVFLEGSKVIHFSAHTSILAKMYSNHVLVTIEGNNKKNLKSISDTFSCLYNTYITTQ